MMNQLTHTRRGISLAETVVSTLLIAMVMVSTLQIVSPLVGSATVHADRLIAAELANELIEEIAAKEWTSPILNDPDAMGPGVGETRPTYDDIDDYDGWSSSPPKLSSGQSNLNLTGWTRSVKVDHVLLADPDSVSATFTGLKRVVVSVSKSGTELCTIQSLHSQAADSVGFIVLVK